jgi:hypothetical protein
MLLVTIAGYFWQGYHDGVWWSLGYMESMMIPFTICPVILWFMLVPSLIAYSKEEFRIDTLFNVSNTISWSELIHYGNGENVFMLQFENKRTFQISAMAYSKTQWDEFISFLETNFPEKKATGYIGPWMFKWRK